MAEPLVDAGRVMSYDDLLRLGWSVNRSGSP